LLKKIIFQKLALLPSTDKGIKLGPLDASNLYPHLGMEENDQKYISEES
jgi:hypothetical protein